jgi:hypothetical protein
MTGTDITRVAPLLLAALSVSTLAHADAAADRAASRVRTAPIEAHVAFLADDLLEGRGTGSRGYDLAARYVAMQFKQFGLEPGGPGGSWYQPVQLIEATAVLPAARVTLLRDGVATPLEYGTHFLPGVDYREKQVEIEAPLVFAGFGVQAPELQHDDFAGLDLKGKVAVIFGGAPARFPHDERAFYSWRNEKNRQLIERGAVGVVTIDTMSDEKRVPWEKVVQQAWRPRMRFLDAQGIPVEDFAELRGRFALSSPAAMKLFEGAPQTYERTRERAEAGEPQGFDLPGRLSLRTVSTHRTTESSNVLGFLRGSDPELANEVIVVTAHLDHLGRQAGMPGSAAAGDLIYNGAHDNASGIATLLETARALAESGVKLRRSVMFAAVTGEENGLIGSEYLARNMPVPGGWFVANVNMDMPMALVALKDFIAFGEQHSTLGPVAKRAATREKYILTPDPRPEEVFFIRSDQFSFVRNGVPAIYLDGGSQAADPSLDGAAIASAFLKDHYHQATDDLEVPMDYPTLAGLARVNVRVITEVANAREAPKWNDGSLFGAKFGRK